jgi:hypothetical protein
VSVRVSRGVALSPASWGAVVPSCPASEGEVPLVEHDADARNVAVVREKRKRSPHVVGPKVMEARV